MMMMLIVVVLVLCCGFNTVVVAFAPPQQLFHAAAARSTAALFQSSPADSGIQTGVIWGIREDDEAVDFGRCGVKLAQESAVKISGSAAWTPQSTASAEWDLIDHYTAVTYVDDDSDEIGNAVSILASAVGIENYKPVGESTTKTVLYAPLEAAKTVLAAAAAASLDSCSAEEGQQQQLVVNIAGGNDLQVSEVLEAVEMIATEMTTASSNTKITWNSLAFKDFPAGQATMVVTALKESTILEDESGSSSSLTGVAQSLANGEVYLMNDKYLTVVEENVIEDFSDE